ncbi:MAG: FapA family protein [Spirochaetaceae bacterium]|jgi:uncharacterized protein (DUF342 family)|nr:FapA family protein [Spirochaetaceae bacterium]
MVDFVQLQAIMKQRLTEDRGIRTVDTEGPTLEAAVAEASTLLNLPVKRIDYEITEQGFSGFLGVGKKEWKIRAYPRLVTTQDVVVSSVSTNANMETAAPVIVDKDGDVFVHLDDDGANLKVVAPVMAGKRVTKGDAMRALKAKGVIDIDEDLVATVVNEAKSIYIRVGSFNRKYTNDGMVSVNVTDQDMRAYITLTPPGPGGIDMSFETVINVLQDNRVVYGIKEDFLREFLDRPSYRVAVLVAEGTPVENGKDAYIEYLFQTSQKRGPVHEGTDGRVDFRDVSNIQNVVKDQPLARKVPPGEGIVGRTVVGGYLSAKAGGDIDIPLGNNVRLGEDRITIVSDINGQVMVAAGVINVEPVYTVQGNVNLKTGNIIFLGTVIITGNVEDGFSVKAQGNIEVKGSVEMANLEAEGDIVVQKGITGRNTGTVKAGKSVYARFIENAVIEAGNMVIVSDGIINSRVDALKRIVCKGKRATIVGGHLRATEEINAKVIGSAASGTETICEVGVDPKSKKELDTLMANKANWEKEIEQIKLDFQTLNNILQQRKSLPEDKEQQMQELMERHRVLLAEIKEVDENIANIREMINTVKIRGRVSASEKILPGVKVIIRDVMETVKTEYKATTFILENELIRVTKYEEPDEEAKRAPDGYTAN